MNGERTVKALALFAAVQATFSDVHPFCDQIVQTSTDARDTSKPGWVGRKACRRHVATYSANLDIEGVADPELVPWLDALHQRASSP